MTQEIKNKTPSHLEFPFTLLKLAIDGSFWNYLNNLILTLPSRVCKRESKGLPHLFHRLHGFYYADCKLFRTMLLFFTAVKKGNGPNKEWMVF